jgi:oligopeptide transport system substrate-binding protein
MRRTVDPATAAPYADVLWPVRHAKAITAGKLPPTTLGVKALSPHTLQITLTAPTPYLLQLLTHHSTYPIYRPALKKYGRHFARPGRLVSNGAYQLKSWMVNAHITLVRNSYYWNNAKTVIGRVIYYPIDNEASELARFRAGDLDITATIPVTQYHWIRRHLGDELHVTPYLSTYFYGFNVTRPPFKNAPKLRQALSMAINRQIIAHKVVGTGVVPAFGFVPPGVNNYTAQRFVWAHWPRAKRLAKARRLYKAAGYGPAHPLNVEIRFNSGEIHKRIAEAVAAMWKANLGVKTHLINEEWKVFLQERAQKKVTQVFRAGWAGDYNDAYAFAEILQGGSPLNETGWRSPRYDQLIRQAAHEKNLTKRRKLLQAAERVVLKDNPIMPIYYYVSKHLVKPYVGGWHDSIVDYHYTKALYIKAH